MDSRAAQGTVPSRVDPAPAGLALPAVRAAALVVGLAVRWWDLGGPSATPDELFTGVVSRAPLLDIPSRIIQRGDTHPPLDYLLRHPFVDGDSLTALRAPSAVAATLTLLLVWWWMRSRGWFGAAVLALTAVSPFLVFYGREARMYALVILAGTIVAVAAERWLETGDRRWIGAMGAALASGLLAESSMVLVALGALLLVGARRDGAAWAWRAGWAAGIGVWVLAWAWRIPGQYADNGAAWIPLLGPGEAVDVVGQLAVVFQPTSGVVLVVLGILGCVALSRTDRHLTRVIVAVAAVPFALGLLASFVLHIGVARSFAPVAWAVPLVVAAAIVAAADRLPLLGVAAAVLVGLLILPSTGYAMTFEDQIGAAVRVVGDEGAPGDVVAIGAPALAHVLEWTWHRGTTGILPGTTSLREMAVDGETTGGRLWTIEIGGSPVPASGRQPCAQPVRTFEDVVVRCYEPEGFGVTPPR